MNTKHKLACNKKAFDLSWSMMGWIILGLVVLVVMIIIMKKSTDPGFAIFQLLGM